MFKRKSMDSKLIALLLTLALVLSSFSVFALDDDDDDYDPNDPSQETELLEDEPEGPAEDPQEEESLDPTAPALVGNVSGAVGSASYTLTLSWKAVPQADRYLVKIMDGENVLVDTSTTALKYSYTIPSGAEYTCKVATVYTDEESVEQTLWADPYVTNTDFAFSAPSAPKLKFKYTQATDNTLLLTWTIDNSEGIASYDILRGKKATVSSMTKVASVDASSTTDVSYIEKTAGTFYYAIRANSDPVEQNDLGIYAVSGASSKITVKAFLNETVGLEWYSKTKKKCTLYANSTGSAKAGTLKKGVSFVAIGKYPDHVAKFKKAKRVKIRTSDGTEGWLPWSSCKGGIKARTVVSKDYSRTVKENFVNSKGYSSDTNYLIWASPKTQRAYVFKGSKGNWSLVRSDRITTGYFSQPTGARQTTIYKRKSKKYMVTEKGRRYYTKYVTYFGAGVSFHTGTWWADTGKKRGSVKKNGSPNTYGCIRMYDAGAKYIYGLPLGTFTVITKTA